VLSKMTHRRRRRNSVDAQPPGEGSPVPWKEIAQIFGALAILVPTCWQAWLTLHR
jgi:hypothetical protein